MFKRKSTVYSAATNELLVKVKELDPSKRYILAFPGIAEDDLQIIATQIKKLKAGELFLTNQEPEIIELSAAAKQGAPF